MTSQLSLRGLLMQANSFLSRLSLSIPLLRGFDVVPYTPLSAAPSCPIGGPLSCHNNTPVTGDACCFIYPSGRLLLAQFWDDEIKGSGSEEDWTIHGLWPDLCDGRYDTFCGMTPKFTNITEILRHYGQDELLANMDRFWLAASGPNSRLWTHEYNKHASCINTLSNSCYGEAYRPGLEVVDYFTRAFQLFRTLDTFTALSLAGIAPDGEKTYKLADIERTLEEYSGGRVILKCNGSKRDILHEAWYVYFVKGSLQSGAFVPAKNLGEKGDKGNCASTVRYLPKKCRSGSCLRIGEL